MENIKKNSYLDSNDIFKIIQMFLFSSLGIIIFFIPIKINNQFETLIYHFSYMAENKLSIIIDISLILFITLSTLKKFFTKERTFINNLSLLNRVFALIILTCILFGREELFFIDDIFIVVMKDMILNLVILLPISSIFMPLILEYGLIEIVEAYTHKIMKKIFKVSGKVFLNFLVYIFVDNVCGAFITYKLYKDGKLREREACITILNFSILSFTLTSDLCNKVGINTFKFVVIEILLLIICNIIVCRIYPLNKKKQSYFYKSGYKDINCRKNKLNTAIKKHLSKGKKKSLLSYSMYYLNDAFYFLIELTPIVVVIFFISNIIYNCIPIINLINNFTYMIISIFGLPNNDLMSNIINLSFFNNILGIKLLSEDTYYITKLILSLVISLQCISFSFFIPFIKKSVIPLKLGEIILVLIERIIIIMTICFIGYNFYLKYIL